MNHHMTQTLHCETPADLCSRESCTQMSRGFIRNDPEPETAPMPLSGAAVEMRCVPVPGTTQQQARRIGRRTQQPGKPIRRKLCSVGKSPKGNVLSDSICTAHLQCHNGAP